MPQSSPRQRRRLQAFWYGRSVRTQLLLVFVLIDLAAALVAGSITIWRARTQTRIEMAASIRLAELLVGDAVNLVHQQLPAEQFLAVLPAQLRSLRHVRIAVKDAAGIPIAAAPSAVAAVGRGSADGRRSDERAPAPAWFAALVAPPIETHVVPVSADGHSVGQVEITGEPADEIAETWENAVAIGVGALLLNVAMIGVLYVLFGRVLGPLTVLASGLSELEQQTYSVRLPRPPARELAAIAEHFNALALALETVRAENLRLNRRLITAQDDERRRTALELHDEVGPCLFGLKANASSIASAAGELPDKAKQSVSERLHDMLAIIEHLQAINRTMLDRLRPMALGHVPLRELVDQLVRDRSRQHPQMTFSLAAENVRRSYGDFDRPHRLPLRTGKPDQRHSARAGEKSDRPTRASQRRGAARTQRARRRPRGGPRRAARFRHSRHAGASRGSGRPFHDRERVRRRHLCARRRSPARAPKRTLARGGCRRRCAGMSSVLIIDDHPIVLQGCRRMLQDAGVAAVLEARDAVSGYRLYRRHRPEVVIVDLAMQGSGLGGLPLIRRIRSHDPQARIMVLSMHSDPIIVSRALEAGATGYVLKDTSSEDLLKAFAKVQAGTPYLSGDLAMQVALAHTSARQNPLAELTPRELQILSLLAEGKPYGRIAEEINVSYKTVVNVSSQLKQKLDARNLPELIRTAVQLLQAAPIAKTSRPDLEKLP